jgi:hypothetical protein
LQAHWYLLQSSNHALFATQRHTTALSGLAAGLSRLAEAEWVRACEQVRRSAPSIGTVGEWRVLCEGGWTNPIPGDLPEPSINDGVDLNKAHSTPEAAIPSRPIISGADIVDKPEYPDSPISNRKSSEGQSGTEQLSTHPPASRPLSPRTKHEVIQYVLQKETLVAEPDDIALTSLSGNKAGDSVDSSNFTASSSTRSSAVNDSTNGSSAFGGSTTHTANVEAVPTDQQHRRIEDPVSNPDQLIRLETQATKLPPSQPIVSPEALPSENNVTEATRNTIVDVVDEQKLDTKANISQGNARPPERGRNAHADGRLDRRSSVESSNSLVAAMRERYDTRPVGQGFTLVNTLHIEVTVR